MYEKRDGRLYLRGKSIKAFKIERLNVFVLTVYKYAIPVSYRYRRQFFNHKQTKTTKTSVSALNERMRVLQTNNQSNRQIQS